MAVGILTLVLGLHVGVIIILTSFTVDLHTPRTLVISLLKCFGRAYKICKKQRYGV